MACLCGNNVVVTVYDTLTSLQWVDQSFKNSTANTKLDGVQDIVTLICMLRIFGANLWNGNSSILFHDILSHEKFSLMKIQ